jgi:acyl carrier protein
MSHLPTELPERLAEVLRPFLRFAGDEPLAADSDLRRLGLDSMQAIDLLFALEDTFGISLADDLMTDETFRTAGNLWSALESSAPGVPAEGLR